MQSVKLPATIALVLGIVAGILEYLNQTTFGFPNAWYNVVKFGLFVITTFGVTAATGHQLGLAIENLLHFSPAVINGIGVAAVVLGGAVTTFGISGVVKGIILGAIAFVTSAFGPFPGLPVAGRHAPTPAPAPGPAPSPAGGGGAAR